ncbi:hypothetical protein TNCV_2890991 [Trichonephila clavipes]|nr:hypothetical protein TNCV_2890991 [Trichonephila clavipes]
MTGNVCRKSPDSTTECFLVAVKSLAKFYRALLPYTTDLSWYWARARDKARHDLIPIPYGYRGYYGRPELSGNVTDILENRFENRTSPPEIRRAFTFRALSPTKSASRDTRVLHNTSGQPGLHRVSEGIVIFGSRAAIEFSFGGKERPAQRRSNCSIVLTARVSVGKAIFGSRAAIEFIFEAVPRVNS